MVRRVLLATSPSAKAADPGATVEQERADRLEPPRHCQLSTHRLLPRLRGRSAQGDRQGYRAHSCPGRGRRLQQGELLSTSAYTTCVLRGETM